MIGSIMFSIVKTKSEVAFAILVASCFAPNQGYQHIEVVKSILRYFKGSRDQGINYGDKDGLLIEGYSDSD